MTAGSAKEEWAAGWPLLVTCAVGLSAATLAHYSLGLFMVPLEKAFGWSRTQASMGLSVSLLVAFLMAPVVGRAADLTNARILALAGTLLTGGAFASFSLANGSVTLWVALWIVHALCASLISPVVWLAAIPPMFQANRSFATAMVLSGTSLGVAFAPTLAQHLINVFDWRIALRLVALIWFGVTLAMVVLFFFDRRPHRTEATSEVPKAHQAGAFVRALFLSPTFLKLALVTFLVFTVEAAYMVHMVPALVDKGFAPLEAAKLVGVCGLAAILGKLFVGGLFDRLSFEIVSMGALAMLALACGLYVPLHGRVIPAIIAVCVLGAAVGAMYTVIACVSAKLFPAATFGLMFGTLTSIMALASAAGPTVGSLVHDRFKSYDPICLVGVGVAVVSALVLKTLKPASVESVPEAVKAE